MQQRKCEEVKKFFSNQTASRRLNTVLYLIVACLCSACIIFFSSSSHASELQEQTWSLRFNNVAIGDVLKQLSRATGVEISTNKTPNMERITRSYEDQTIEDIIRDALRGTNYTLVWHYGEKQLEFIGICFFDAGSGGPDTFSDNRRGRPNNRVVGRPLDRNQPRSQRQITQPKRRVSRDLSANKSKPKTAPKKEGSEDEDDIEDDGDDETDAEDEE